MRFTRLPAEDAAAVPADAFVLDVREADEWAAGHIESAVHIPMSEFAERAGELPADRRTYVICRSGRRSAQVTHYLVAQGRDAVNVHGGMLAWASAGRPMVSDDGSPPTVL